MDRSLSADQLLNPAELLLNSHLESNTSTIHDDASYIACLEQNSLTPLNNIPKDGIISVIGFVVSFTAPRMSSGREGDYFTKIQIIDPTNMNDERPITYMVFATLASLPQVTHTGDIIYLSCVKCQRYNGNPQLVKNYHTKFNIIPYNAALEGDYDRPIIRYLRTACSARTGDQVAAPYLPLTTTGSNASSSFSFIAPPVNLSSPYFRIIADMRPGQFADVNVEILSIEVSQTNVLQRTPLLRCLVTDYSENPSITCRRFTSLPGYRVIPCDFNYPDDIPKMPELSVGCSLRLRNCQMLNDPEWGVRLSISKDTKYPRSLVVKLLDPTMCGVNELLDRKNECHVEPADAASFSEDGDNATEEGAEDFPDATALSDVCASSKVNVRYRVRATVTKSYPSSVEESLVDDQCRVILELSDATDAADGQHSAKCLAFFLATTPPSLLKLLHLPADCVDKQEAMQRISRILAAPREVDLIVAACLVPGPHDIPTRCLLIEKFISPI